MQVPKTLNPHKFYLTVSEDKTIWINLHTLMILLKPWVSNDLVTRRWHQKLWRKFINAQCVSIIACNVFCHLPFPDNIILTSPCYCLPVKLVFAHVLAALLPPLSALQPLSRAPGPSLSTLISIDNECTVHTVNLKTGPNSAPVPHWAPSPAPARLLIPLVWWDCSTFTRENILIRY